MRRDFQVKISPSAISRWTLGQLSAGQTPFEPRELQFSSVLCIDEVFVSVGGRKVLVLIAARLWQRLFCTPSWKAAILKASELPFSSSKSWGADPERDRQRPGQGLSWGYLCRFSPRRKDNYAGFTSCKSSRGNWVVSSSTGERPSPKAEKRRLWQLRGKLLSGNRKLTPDDQASVARFWGNIVIVSSVRLAR